MKPWSKIMVQIWNNLLSEFHFYNEVTETLKIVKGPEAWCTPLNWQKWIKPLLSGPFDILYIICRIYICFNNIDHFDYSTYHSNIYFPKSKSCETEYIWLAAMYKCFRINIVCFKYQLLVEYQSHLLTIFRNCSGNSIVVTNCNWYHKFRIIVNRWLWYPTSNWFLKDSKRILKYSYIAAQHINSF